MAIYISFPNLAAEMQRRGVNQEQVASATNKSIDTIRNWLKGKGSPSVGVALIIQREFFPDLPISYLFAEKPMYPKTEAV